jgi:hypothetical protein
MARTRQHDRMRAGKVTALARIYNSKQWKAARWQAMHAAEYVCQHPGCTEVLVGPGRCHVHHKKRLRQAMALAYEPLNMRCFARRITRSRPTGRSPRPKVNPSAAVM